MNQSIVAISMILTKPCRLPTCKLYIHSNLGMKPEQFWAKLQDC